MDESFSLAVLYVDVAGEWRETTCLHGKLFKLEEQHGVKEYPLLLTGYLRSTIAKRVM